MPNDNARIDALSRRLRKLEDQLEIRDALVRYGWAVDSNDPDATASLYAEECVIDVGGGREFRGREGVRELVRSDTHQALLPRCAHLTGPVAVQLDGDLATAVGYLAVIMKTTAGYEVWRQGCGRWELERRAGKWLVVRRVSLPVGSPEAQELLNRGLHQQLGTPAT